MEKILIITGGNKGIGAGIAEVYHKYGYHIISISRSHIKKLYTTEQYHTDLSDPKNCESILEEVFSHLSKDQANSITLVNNAGYLGSVGPIDTIKGEDFGYTIGINLIAPLTLSSKFIELTKDWNCKKNIYNISSGAAINPYESWSSYCTSKAGLDMMTRVVAKEQKDIENGVNIVSIYPGVVDTEMQKQVRTSPKEKFKNVQRFIDFYEKGELSSTEEVGEKIYELQEKGILKNGRIVDVRNY